MIKHNKYISLNAEIKQKFTAESEFTYQDFLQAAYNYLANFVESHGDDMELYEKIRDMGQRYSSPARGEQ